VVIDTDLGLDDAVTLALALQSPDVHVAGIVACDGAAGRMQGIRSLECFLRWFNRREIPVYEGVPSKAAAPRFRRFAEEAVASVVDDLSAARVRRPFTPTAYVPAKGKAVVLALGPLTNLAAALTRQPDIVQGIEKIIVAGGPDVGTSWNVGFDPAAFEVVRTSGVPLEFVAGGDKAGKPAAWRSGDPAIGQGTSLAESFFTQLMAAPRVRKHYLGSLSHFHDELVFLFIIDRGIFAARGGDPAVYEPVSSNAVETLFGRLISRGRQAKARVVFADRPLPESVLRSDVAGRRASIIQKNGPDEWFAQVLMNEMHEHLGAYSVIGVKMGLRAAEMLNAPPHSMSIESHTPPRPPVSCLNDGLIVATGSTPGRDLFRHVPLTGGESSPKGESSAAPGTETPEKDDGSRGAQQGVPTTKPGEPSTTQRESSTTEGVRVTFSYGGRTIVLALKPEYQDRIRERIAALRQRHGLEDDEYWSGVRTLGLDIWENWHRRDLFVIVEDVNPPWPVTGKWG
jgi:inosine-uridine nucleoside N-ribohydrolase